MATVCLVNGVFPPDSYGGAENYVSRIASRLRSRGHDAFILTTMPYENSNSFQIQEDCYNEVPVFRFYPFNVNHRSEGTGDSLLTKVVWHQLDTVNPHAKRVTSKFLKEKSPDIIHTNNFMGISASVGKAISNLSAQYIHTLHDYSLICPKSNLLRERTLPGDEQAVCQSPPAPCQLYAHAKRRAIGQPDLVIGPSQHVIDVHREHGFFSGVESSCIQHGVDHVASKPGNPSEPSVLYVGKHLRAKGLDTLFDAARELPEVTFHLCGTGPYASQSETVASTLKNVKYHGYVSDEELRKLRRTVSVAVVPSIWMENSPLTIYESFAEGLPVIGADIGGIPELVGKGRGKLFTPDNPEELIESIRELTLRGEHKSLRTNALEWANQHTLDQHIDQLQEIYHT